MKNVMDHDYFSLYFDIIHPTMHRDKNTSILAGENSFKRFLTGIQNNRHLFTNTAYICVWMIFQSAGSLIVKKHFHMICYVNHPSPSMHLIISFSSVSCKSICPEVVEKILILSKHSLLMVLSYHYIGTNKWTLYWHCDVTRSILITKF